MRRVPKRSLGTRFARELDGEVNVRGATGLAGGAGAEDARFAHAREAAEGVAEHGEILVTENGREVAFRLGDGFGEAGGALAHIVLSLDESFFAHRMKFNRIKVARIAISKRKSGKAGGRGGKLP